MSSATKRRPLPRTPSDTERLCARYSITRPPDLSQGIASRRWLEIGRLLHSLVILPGEMKNKKPFRPILRTAITIVNANRGLLYLREESGDELRVAAEFGFRGSAPEGLRSNNRMVSAALWCRKPLIINYPDEISPRKELKMAGHACSLTVPILRRGSPWGAIQLFRTEPFLEEEAIILWICSLILEELLPALAESTRLTIGMEPPRLETGLIPLEDFNSRVDWEIERAGLSGTSVSLLRIGLWPSEEMGEESLPCLRQSGALRNIRKCLRPVDLIAGWETHDLLVSMPNLDAEQARQIAQEIRRALVQCRALGAEGVVLPLLRMAHASFPTHGSSRKDLLTGLENYFLRPHEGSPPTKN